MPVQLEICIKLINESCFNIVTASGCLTVLNLCGQGRQHSTFLSVSLECEHGDAESSGTARAPSPDDTAGDCSFDGHACQVKPAFQPKIQTALP